MPRYTITESVGNHVEPVGRFEDLEKHHPSSGRQPGREYATINGELEEVRHVGGQTFIKKDFILSQDSPGPVNIPAPATGYIHYLNDATNAVRIYDKPFGTPGAVMLAQSLHMTRGTSPAEGSRIEYGQPMGRMGDTGSPGAVHAHVEAPFDRFKTYIDDIAAGRIRPGGQVNLDPLADGVLQKGESGAPVRRLQEALNRAGAHDDAGRPLNPDGDFGDRTRQAVQNLQRARGLEVDGVAGNDTLTALGLKQAPARVEPAQQNAPRPAAQQGAGPHDFGAGNPLGALIATGEGGYGSYNRGRAGDAHGAQIDFSQMTVAEVMRRQQLPGNDPERLFAVGKYQVIPGTLGDAVRTLRIDPDARFTPQLQERIFADYLIDEKRPQVRAYITGQTDGAQGLQGAQLALAREFASIADPRTGRSVYDGDSAGNSASISAAQVGTALDRMRTQYRQNLQNGMSADDAWRALSGDPAQPAQTQPRASSPSAQGAMADGVLRHGEQGDDVRRLQESLNRAGARDAEGRPLRADGDFGDRTRQAVERFQRDHGLHVDGVAGRDTLGALSRELHAPVLSNRSHPDNGLFQQALKGLETLPANTFKSAQERENAAATIAFEARVGGLARIEAVASNGNGYLFATDRALNDPAAKRVAVDQQHAAQQPVQKSSDMLQQLQVSSPKPEVQPVREAPAQQSPAPPPTRAL